MNEGEKLYQSLSVGIDEKKQAYRRFIPYFYFFHSRSLGEFYPLFSSDGRLFFYPNFPGKALFALAFG